MKHYKYLIPATSNMKGMGILNRRKPLPYAYLRTGRGMPPNYNFVVTLRGTYVIAINVTGV